MSKKKKEMSIYLPPVDEVRHKVRSGFNDSGSVERTKFKPSIPRFSVCSLTNQPPSPSKDVRDYHQNQMCISMTFSGFPAQCSKPDTSAQTYIHLIKTEKVILEVNFSSVLNGLLAWGVFVKYRHICIYNIKLNLVCLQNINLFG